MPAQFLDASVRYPITLPDGQTYPNTVWLNQVIDHPRMRVGDFTYYNDFEPVTDYAARIAPYLHPGSPERLIIGRFGQFAHGVRFITSSADHPKRWFTTYPFAVFHPASMPYFAREFATGADTVIGHDVWIGHGAMILPGVTIGNGAIIGAGAVVARNVPDFAVVAGNPGRIVKMRFDRDVVDLLLALRWWDLPPEEIEPLLPILTTADAAQLRDCVQQIRPDVTIPVSE